MIKELFKVVVQEYPTVASKLGLHSTDAHPTEVKRSYGRPQAIRKRALEEEKASESRETRRAYLVSQNIHWAIPVLNLH